MRIAQIMLAQSFGGAERSFVDLSLALAARGHPLLAIGAARGAALPLLAAQPNIHCVSVCCHGNWDVLAQRAVRRHLQMFAPQVVQAHLARAAHRSGRRPALDHRDIGGDGLRRTDSHHADRRAVGNYR